MSMCLSSSRSLVAPNRGLGGLPLAAPWWRSLVGSALSAGACRWRLRASARASRCSVVVGCCVGADAAVLAPVPGALGAALPGRAVRVLCAWGPGGAGAGPASAVGAVLEAEASGVPVRWWVGGGPSMPLVARLARRTRAVVAEASAGLVVFPAAAVVAGSGSWLAARCAVGRGLPVVVFPIGFAAELLPQLGVGRWVPAGGAGVWDSAWRWVPGQVTLPL